LILAGLIPFTNMYFLAEMGESNIFILFIIIFFVGSNFLLFTKKLNNTYYLKLRKCPIFYGAFSFES
ncbi:hypothetical protein, partial [Cytobacillus praedii]|uniref:hypothetical protein n=1 Tax=Cytobacillus praedii TaxID=1742358 RepID=UPI001A9941FA